MQISTLFSDLIFPHLFSEYINFKNAERIRKINHDSKRGTMSVSTNYVTHTSYNSSCVFISNPKVGDEVIGVAATVHSCAALSNYLCPSGTTFIGGNSYIVTPSYYM